MTFSWIWIALGFAVFVAYVAAKPGSRTFRTADTIMERSEVFFAIALVIFLLER